MTHQTAQTAAANADSAQTAMPVTERQLRDRSVEVGDCWIWQQGTNGKGYPQMKLVGCCTSIPRRMAAMLAGHALVPRQPVEMICGEKMCVNPSHTKPSTGKKIARKAAARGAFSSVTRSARIAAARRQGSLKLTPEQVEEIRASTESGPVLSLRYGVHRSFINRVKLRTQRKDYSSPFAGLGARA